MRLWRSTTLPVGVKFAAAVGAVAISMVSVSVVGGLGSGQLRSDIERLITDDILGIRVVDDLAIDVSDTAVAAQTELGPPGPAAAAATASLDQVLLPRLDVDLQSATRAYADDTGAIDRVAQVSKDLDDYRALRRGAQSSPGGSAGHVAQIALVDVAFDHMRSVLRLVRGKEFTDTAASVERSRSTSSSTQWQLVLGTIVSLLVALTVVLLLVRNLVPRLRLYARFAADIAAGRGVGDLTPRGSDELADLGRALHAMVSRITTARLREAEQVEFTDTLQVTASEEEAHELVQRHLERSLPGSAVAVLQRNNSENRLEAATALVPGSGLGSRLAGAEPRACLAMRLGRTHREDPGRVPLLSCLLCAEEGSRSTCEPLLVGGQVIGSVLVAHQDPLAEEAEARIRNSVTQAAPVLGNLRNLALAEFRANNDSLTGVAEQARHRRHAQADGGPGQPVDQSAGGRDARSRPLQAGQRPGWGTQRGTRVLAAVGAALQSCLRTSDFAGRFGGEELLVLLADTTAQDAVPLAERIRETVEAIRVPGVERAITVSIGIADLIQHGGDAAGLLRQANRALNTAKATGRNRVVVAGTGSADHVDVPRPSPAWATRHRWRSHPAVGDSSLEHHASSQTPLWGRHRRIHCCACRFEGGSSCPNSPIEESAAGIRRAGAQPLRSRRRWRS